MRTAFEYLCLDCLFGRSHSCSCSCWSDSLHCCLLETSSFHSRRWLFFFLRRLDFLCWFNISIIWERNGICYWFEDQRRKMDGWNHKEGWWAGGERAFSCCRGTWGRWAQQGHCGNPHQNEKEQKFHVCSTYCSKSPPPIQQTEPEASGRCVMQERINSGPCFPSFPTWTNDAVFINECEKKSRAAAWEMPTFQLLSVC